MKPGKRCWIVSLLILSLIPGCWDRDDLRDARLLTAAAMDSAPQGKLKLTVVYRELPGGAEQQQPVNEIFSGVGDTLRDARDLLDRRISGNLRTYKNQVLLMGKKLTKQDIYPHLDVIYRDPKSSINPRIAVAEGQAGDMLRLNTVGITPIGEYLDELIESAENNTVVPRESIQLIAPVMLDPGQDFMLPYLKMTPNKKAVTVAGTALFHGHRFTGTLTPDESKLFLLMLDRMGKIARMTKKAHSGNEDQATGYITMDILRSKRDWEVKVNRHGQVDVFIRLDLQAKVEEYPRDQLGDPPVLKKLGKKLSAILTQEARKTIGKMQRARFDGLGVGRKLISYYPEVWKKKRWSRDYPKVRFHPRVQVELVESGIFN